MNGYIRVIGKTVEDAVLEASIQLGTISDNIEYTVIEHETKGFLGLGAKKAVIEAKIKKSDEEYVEEVLEGTKKSSSRSGKNKEKAKDQVKDKAKEKETREKPEKKESRKAEQSKETPEKKEKASGSEKAASAAKEASKTREKKEKSAEQPAAEVKEVQKKEETAEKPAAEHTPRESADPAVVMRRAENFLRSMFDAMGLDVKIETSFENDTLSVDLSGDDMGMLIGKRGQTLDSVQYLTSLVVNKGKAAYVRVKVDTENYRERRKATLENLAKNIAFKVKKNRRSVYLEPMNPYERRIIHSALQNDPYVTTHSEGEEPLRKVVVTLKKKESFQEDEEE